MAEEKKSHGDITNNFYAEWNILENLKLTGRLGLTKKTTSIDDFKPASHTDFCTAGTAHRH